MQEKTGACCAECLETLTKAKGDLLARVACANCQFAEEEPTTSEKMIRQPMFGLGWIARCPDCGKWCWSSNSLALHRELHRSREY